MLIKEKTCIPKYNEMWNKTILSFIKYITLCFVLSFYPHSKSTATQQGKLKSLIMDLMIEWCSSLHSQYKDCWINEQTPHSLWCTVKSLLNEWAIIAPVQWMKIYSAALWTLRNTVSSLIQCFLQSVHVQKTIWIVQE